MQLRSILASAGALALAACSDVQPTAPIAAPAAPSLSQSAAAGGVFVSTNGLNGNAVVAFARAAEWLARSTGTFATGGTGIGGVADPLASQFALALSSNAKFLVVVNAGSNDVSSFAVERWLAHARRSRLVRRRASRQRRDLQRTSSTR